MHSTLHLRALATIDPALRRGPWLTGAWDERARRYGSALVTALREALATLPTMAAVAAAAAAARSELPLASAGFHETWSRVTLVWVVREVVQAAEGQPDPALRDALRRLAAELAAAAAQLGAAEVAGATAAVPFEALVDAAREAFTRTPQGLTLSPDERTFLGAYVHQFKHIASLLAVGGHSVDSLLRGAVTRTDRAVRRDGLGAWCDAPLATRQAWVRRGAAEAAWSLAAQVVREQGRGDAARELALWLARTACQIIARVDRIDAWVPTTERDATATAPATPQTPTARPAEAPPPPPTETTMDPSKAPHPVLKTLELDASEAAWRMAGSQFVKLAKEPIVAMLSRHLGPDDASLRGKIAAFLDTELGAALLSGVLSAGLSAMPLPPNDIAPRLARELRVRSMATAGDAIADVLMGPLRQVAVMYLQGQPSAPANPAGLPPANLVDAFRVATPAEPSEAPGDPATRAG